MRLKQLRSIIVIGCFFLFPGLLNAQGYSFNCARDTIVPGCPAALCITLKTLIPDPSRQAPNYVVNASGEVPTCLLASNNPGIPGAPTTLTVDDKYSPNFPIGFPFTFFGTTYTNLVVSSNGYISFDVSLANGFSHWNIINGGNPQNLPSTFYDRALIMGPYHDLDIGIATSPTRLISYLTSGLAPYRKWILNYRKVPLFSGACNPLIENTQQIILYESTGIIDVNIFDKQSQLCTGWNQGRAMVGLQDFSRTAAIMPPGRRATDPLWGSVNMNESWRFVPSGGTPLFRRVELYDLIGNLLSTGTTVVLPTGDREVSFANICAPPGVSTPYVIKAFYDKIDDPTTEIFATDTIRINRLLPLSANATSTPASCGTPNGTITVSNVVGGTPPYEYSIDGGLNWQSSNFFPGLAAGTYTVLIRDAGAVCTTSIQVTVGVTGTIPETHTVAATSCIGVNNGSITITSAGGTGPYSFVLDGGPPQFGVIPYTFPNPLSSGLHTVVVTDISTGCNTGIFQVNVPAGIGVTGFGIGAATSCPNANDGSITVTALTGTAPFTWVLDGVITQVGPSPHVFPGVAAGNHFVTITDVVGCNVIIPNINVASGPGITATTTSSPTACATATNGDITVTSASGTGPYTFSIDGGSPQPGTIPYFIPGLAAGLHTIIITDATGCTTNPALLVVIAAGPGVSGTATPSATSCPTAANGSISVDATAGTPPFTWQLDGGGPQNGPSPYLFPGVSAGSHFVTIRDSYGCILTINNVIVNAGPTLTATITPTGTSCSGATNGKIDITSASGTGPNYEFSLDGGAPQTNTIPYTFLNVSAGPHTVLVTDLATGCVSNLYNVIVAAGPQLTATITPTGTSCSGATNGKIDITSASGTGPNYEFSLDGGAPQTNTIPYTFLNVSAGPHTVLVTDLATGCVSNLYNVTVAAGPVLTTTATVEDVFCNGGATGKITVVQPAIGTAPFEYSVNGGPWQISNIFPGLAAGAYTVSYRESNGCMGSHQEIINEPAAMNSSATITAAICNGQNNGSITVIAGGGVAPYEYSINGGVNWQGNNIFPVGAGVYTIIIRDVNNCTTTQSATVTEPAVLTAASVNNNASCDGGNDGLITITANGGNGGFQYSLDGGPLQALNTFNVAPGNYTITVNDNQGCSTSFNTVVGLTNNLTFTPQTDPTICEGTSTQLQLTSNATIYTWTPATGLSNPNISNPVANPMVTTQYTVTATLGRCSANDMVIVNVNAAPVPDAGPDGFICYGQTYQLQGTGGVQYTWTPSTNLSSTSISNPVSTAPKTITYILSEVVDGIGCKSLTTDQVTVDVTPPIKVTTFPFDTISYPGDQFQLNATSAATFYSWSPATGLSNPNIPNPVLTVGQIGSDVLYQVIASTAAGCKGEGYVNLKVYKGPELYVPSAFSPNRDGLNDLFYPFPVGIVDNVGNIVGITAINYFKVFNRWGQLLFSTTTLYKGWDGKFQGVDQPTGVYVFMAQGVAKNGKIITHNGTVALIR